MKIVIFDTYTTTLDDTSSWDELAALGTLSVYARTRKDEVIERAKDADIVLTNKVCLGREEMEQLPILKYIGVMGTGYNVVDVEVARERGIIVTNVPAYSTESVAQLVFAHLLAVTNHTEHYAHQNREGRWTSNADFCYWDTPLVEIFGKTIGIVGLGNIGSRVAAIAQAFGMKVLAYTSKSADALPNYIEKKTIEQLLAESDVISLHCPLTPQTRHLINRESLLHVKSSAILINTGRGPLVNDQDVADALGAGRLAVYCADVLSEEPPRSDNPLLHCEKAFITPHIAWATSEARCRLVTAVIGNIRAFIEGHPQNIVI